MLEDVVPVEWSKAHDGSWSGRPLGPLPKGLGLLAAPSVTNPLAERRCPANGISLYPAWIFQDEGIILASRRVTYLPSSETFVLTPHGLASALSELPIEEQLGPLSVESAGCRSRLERQVVSPTLWASLWPQSEAGWTDPQRNVLSVAAMISDRPALPPSALGFHSSTRPADITLTVEVTTACNYRCSFCYGRHMKQGVLRRAGFVEMLDRTPGLSAIEFTGEGEPLLNRDTLAMIDECKARGLWVHLSSNGSKIDDALADRLISSGVDAFSFSMESVDPERFAALRPNGKLSDVANAARAIVAARARHAGSTATVSLWVSLLRDALKEVDRFFSFAEQVGADKVEFQPLNPLPAYSRFYDQYLQDQILGPTDVANSLSDPTLSGRARKALQGLMASFDSVRCDRFMAVLAPSFQGDLSPCCLLKPPDFGPFGNLKSERLEDLWEREDFYRFRFALQHGVVLSSCDGCPAIAGA